ncbi:hypothetical protein ACIBKZ_22400 [Streptomyces sp. NPDC050421]|uniref:hypothetical protein n=1 Tax=Streptomyces sp. NPDC050421 TaxID=3365613 RepID=UPI00378A1419
MNARRVNAAAGVIHAAQKTRQTAAGIASALEAAGLLQSPETAAEQVQLNNDVTGACLARWEEEQDNARLRLALASAQRGRRDLRARVAELEAQAAKVAAFCAQRAEYVTSLLNCAPDNSHDYDRWQGHAESRRQLSQSLGLPVGWPAETEPRPVPAPVEDPHDSPLHTDYATPHDLPAFLSHLSGGDLPADAVREKRCLLPPIGCGRALVDSVAVSPSTSAEYRITGLCPTCQDRVADEAPVSLPGQADRRAGL